MTIRVNGEEVPPEAVQFEMDRLVKFYSDHMSDARVKDMMDEIREKAREQAIGVKLLMQEALRLDIKVPARDIDARVDQMVKNAGGQEAFAKLLVKQNLDERALRQSIENGRRLDAMVEKITSGAAEPTEDMIESFFKEHAGDYRRPAQAQVQHILIKADPDDKENRAVARSRLMAICKKIKDGSDFSDQATIHSDCPSGKRSGGALGWVARGSMIPVIDRAVFDMEVNGISGIVETPLGCHVFRKTAEEEGAIPELDEVRDNVRDILRHSIRGGMISSHIQELMEKAIIEDDCRS